MLKIAKMVGEHCHVKFLGKVCNALKSLGRLVVLRFIIAG